MDGGPAAGTWFDLASESVRSHADDLDIDIEIVWWDDHKGHGRGVFERHGDVVEHVDPTTDDDLQHVDFDVIYIDARTRAIAEDWSDAKDAADDIRQEVYR